MESKKVSNESKLITQETFDDVVKENIIEFSMAPDEAIAETTKQFEAMGINLCNIVKDLTIDPKSGRPMLYDTIDILKKHVANEHRLGFDELISYVKCLNAECGKSVPHRILASKYGGFDVLITLLKHEFDRLEEKEKSTKAQSTTDDEKLVNNENEKDCEKTKIASNEEDLMLQCIRAAGTIVNGYPDVFGNHALKVAEDILNKYSKKDNNEEMVCATLQLISRSCVMHEMNRRKIMNSGLLEYILPYLTMKNDKIIREICAVFRNLVLDDDIRIEFGNAHEHARTIASKTLTDLTKMLVDYDNVDVLSDLMLTIATLTLRQEFCVTVDEAGGLKYIYDAVSKNPDSVKLNREALKLIRALAGHDAIKSRMIDSGLTSLIHEIFMRHKKNESIVATALACISTTTLRNKENSLHFFNSQLPELVVDVMVSYPKNKAIQRNAAWVIRNMVCRLQTEVEKFLVLGVEDVLNKAMSEHPSIEYDIKSALRDLGCKVNLREEWTGKSTIKIQN